MTRLVSEDEIGRRPPIVNRNNIEIEKVMTI